MRVFHCDRYEVPLPLGHRFPIAKYRRLREALLERDVLMPAELTEATPIEPQALLLAHDSQYVEAVLEGTLDEAALRRLGFPWSRGLVMRSRASVGGTLAAARHALEHGFAGNLAGGTHHAHAGHGEGYCVFNDLAVTCRTLFAEKRIERAVIVDLDVHQGDGTAAIFENDDRVFTFSMHGERNFPFRKARSSRDVGLDDGVGDGVYLELLEQHLPEVLEAAGADLLLYQGGVDALASDALGRLQLTHQGLRGRDAFVFELAKARGLPVVTTLGGGYAKPIEDSIDAHVGTYLEARRAFG